MLLITVAGEDIVVDLKAGSPIDLHDQAAKPHLGYQVFEQTVFHRKQLVASMCLLAKSNNGSGADDGA